MAYKADELKKLERYAESEENNRISKKKIGDEEEQPAKYGYVTVMLIEGKDIPIVRKGDVLNEGSVEYCTWSDSTAEPVESVKLPYVMGGSDADAWINQCLRDPESELSKAVAQYR